MNKYKGNVVMVVVAHPDDEILGCGGTITRFIEQEGYVVHVLILSHGITSRDNWDEQDINILQQEMYKANQTVGVKKSNIYLENFPDNRFDTVPLLDIVKTISKHVQHVKPDMVFTHHHMDLNVDHRITFQGVITACRPLNSISVRCVLCMEVLSSTEWNPPQMFSPNVFYDVSSFIDKKLEALECYRSELRVGSHPRSLKAVRGNAGVWGCKLGVGYAEAFEVVRWLI